MARCEECVHYEVCLKFADVRIILCGGKANERCKLFKPTADVAPRAEWISVEERLPDENGRFLTVDKIGDMMVCYWEKHFGWFAIVCNKNAITHWMPLPEPPKGD
jgi:hypothetical protein